MIRYTQTDRRGKRVEFAGPTIDRCVENCLTWRERNPGNGTPDHDVILAQVTTQLTANNGLAKAQEESNKASFLPRHWTLEGLMHGAKAVLKNLAGKIVSNDEIKRRAWICVECPLRVESVDCKTCSWGAKLAKKKNEAMRAFGKGFSIPSVNGKDLSGGGCDACGCAMLIVLPARIEEFQHEAQRVQDRRPANCWAKWNGPNFQHPASS